MVYWIIINCYWVVVWGVFALHAFKKVEDFSDWCINIYWGTKWMSAFSLRFFLNNFSSYCSCIFFGYFFGEWSLFKVVFTSNFPFVNCCITFSSPKGFIEFWAVIVLFQWWVGFSNVIYRVYDAWHVCELFWRLLDKFSKSLLQFVQSNFKVHFSLPCIVHFGGTILNIILGSDHYDMGQAY